MLEKPKIHVKLSGYMELPEDGKEEVETHINSKKEIMRISINAPVEDYIRFKAEATRQNMNLMEYMIYCAKMVTDAFGAERE